MPLCRFCSHEALLKREASGDGLSISICSHAPFELSEQPKWIFPAKLIGFGMEEGSSHIRFGRKFPTYVTTHERLPVDRSDPPAGSAKLCDACASALRKEAIEVSTARLDAFCSHNSVFARATVRLWFVQAIETAHVTALEAAYLFRDRAAPLPVTKPREDPLTVHALGRKI